MKFLLLSVLFLATAAAQAETSWLHLRLVHNYQDKTLECRGYSYGGNIYFGFEHEGDAVSRVVVSNYPYVWPYQPIYKAIEFTAGEKKSMKLFRDKKGRAWLREMTLEEPTLMFLLYWGGKSNGHCVLPQFPRTMTPSPQTIVFETEGLEEGIWVSDSPTAAYKGQRADGETYNATMKIIQREYKRYD